MENKTKSLDLAGKKGVAYSTAEITAVAGVVDTLFSATELKNSDQYVIKVNTTAADVDISTIAAPSTLTFIEDGDQVTFIKTSVDRNVIKLDDKTPGANLNGFSGVIFSYVDKPGESITLIADVSNNKWGVQI